MRVALSVFLCSIIFGRAVWAAPSQEIVSPSVTPTAPVVKFKAGRDLNFEQLVIEGQLKRPELSLDTDDSEQNGNGLLRLRENFIDRMAENAGQDMP